jgi:hypothetical protein
VLEDQSVVSFASRWFGSTIHFIFLFLLQRAVFPELLQTAAVRAPCFVPRTLGPADSGTPKFLKGEMFSEQALSFL